MKIPLSARVLAGVAIGVALGAAFGEKNAPLGEAGLLVIRLLKALAAPLIFFSVVDALLRTNIAAKKGAILIVISIVNASVATGIGFGVGELFEPEPGS
ncbi:MAG TPA: cation:dicarboxylase symporter family transporter, partial [Myxococcota bacterium]